MAMLRFPGRYEPNVGTYGMGILYGSPVGDASVTLYFDAHDDNHPNGHGGVDLACALDTPVILTVAGTSAECGYDSVRGNFVRVAHADGWFSEYLHLRDQAPFSFGQDLPAGTQLGVIGLTGLTTGPHEHISVIGPDGALYNLLGCLELPPLQPGEVAAYVANGGAWLEQPSTIEGTRLLQMLVPVPAFPGPLHVP